MSDPIVPTPIPSGQEREQQIYAGALFGTTTAIPAAISLLEQKAKETLAPPAFDYLAGGAGGEDTMRAKRFTAGGSCRGCCATFRGAI